MASEISGGSRKSDLYDLKLNVEPREGITDKSEIELKLKNGVQRLITFIISKYTKRRSSAQSLISPDTLINILDLSEIRPPATEKQLDAIVFSVSKDGFVKSGSSYEVRNPELILKDAENYWVNKILEFFKSDPEKPLTCIEISEGVGLGMTKTRETIKELIANGTLVEFKWENAKEKKYILKK